MKWQISLHEALDQRMQLLSWIKLGYLFRSAQSHWLVVLELVTTFLKWTWFSWAQKKSAMNQIAAHKCKFYPRNRWLKNFNVQPLNHLLVLHIQHACSPRQPIFGEILWSVIHIYKKNSNSYMKKNAFKKINQVGQLAYSILLSWGQMPMLVQKRAPKYIMVLRYVYIFWGSFTQVTYIMPGKKIQNMVTSCQA